MLRGPQTSGELRDRSERMRSFSDLEEVEACLEGLMRFEPSPLVTRLARQPGTKEPRYIHLLSGAGPRPAQGDPEPPIRPAIPLAKPAPALRAALPEPRETF